jgi:hypothetical protein
MDRIKLKQEISGKVIQTQSCEYMVVAYPGEAACGKIMDVRKEFSDNYKKKIDDSKPFITAASFLAKEDMEETLIRWMQRICGQQRSFAVTLNNYSGIPLHTLYLRVFDHQPFRQLANHLQVIDQYIRTNDCHEVKLTSRPYLPVARGLSEGLYERAIKDYSLKSFCETFRVNELVLLRRNNLNDSYKAITVFSFLP